MAEGGSGLSQSESQLIVSSAAFRSNCGGQTAAFMVQRILVNVQFSAFGGDTVGGGGVMISVYLLFFHLLCELCFVVTEMVLMSFRGRFWTF